MLLMKPIILQYKQRNLLYYYVKLITEKKKTIINKITHNKPKAWIYIFYLI